MKIYYPSIHFYTHLIQFWVTGGWSLSQLPLGREVGYTLTYVFLDGVRKLEYPERTHACTGTKCKLHAERP